MGSRDVLNPNLPEPWSGKFEGTFCYNTIKDRMPVILTKVIDQYCRKKQLIAKEYGGEAVEELKSVAGSLSQLKNELQTNKPIKPLEDGHTDVESWNQYLVKHQQLCGSLDGVSWFRSPWLYIECYMYRRIAQAFWLTKHLKHLDWFRDQKENSLFGSMEAIKALSAYLLDLLPRTAELSPEESLNHAINLIKVCLWGNKCDLSISGGDDNVAKQDPVQQLQKLETNIIVNHSQTLRDQLDKFRKQKNTTVCWILDNAGFELFTDLCVVDYLCECGIFNVVEFHVKTTPWFVSDTTKHDFHWTLEQLCQSSDDKVKQMAKRWKERLNCGTWSLREETFWTLPHDFSEMQDEDPKLYERLGKADIVVFKGDLNYRKLTGDLIWDTTVSLKTALREFAPGPPIVSLRTLKCDVIVGLPEGMVQKLDEECEQWRVCGEYAVMQMAL